MWAGLVLRQDSAVVQAGLELMTPDTHVPQLPSAGTMDYGSEYEFSKGILKQSW